MTDHARHAVLGVLVAMLAVCALAQQRRGHVSYEIERAPRADGSGAVIRALRDGETIDLNRATADELVLLPGIGPALAQHIVELRTARGRLESTRELLDVRGIGPTKLAKIERFARVTSALPTQAHSQNSQVNESVTEK
jgi:competence ComEA-like helix-hairpin-helix protein